MARIKRLQNPEAVPQNMQAHFDAITQQTDSFCKEHLNSEEYGKMAHNLTAALCHKKLSPVLSGHTNTWAAGVVYALGFVNFLFDRSSAPYISAGDLCTAFGISTSTGASKSKQIRDLLKMSQCDPQWTLPSKMDENPFIWMLEYNGLPFDIRNAPLEVQVCAFNKGLIPYIPALK